MEDSWQVQPSALVYRRLLETSFVSPEFVRQWAQSGLAEGFFAESLPLAERLMTAPPSELPALLGQIAGPVLDGVAFGWITGHLLEGWLTGEHLFPRVMAGLTWVNDALSSGCLVLGQDLVESFAAEPYGLAELVQRYAWAKDTEGEMERLQADVDKFLQGYAE